MTNATHSAQIEHSDSESEYYASDDLGNARKLNRKLVGASFLFLFVLVLMASIETKKTVKVGGASFRLASSAVIGEAKERPLTLLLALPIQYRSEMKIGSKVILEIPELYDPKPRISATVVETMGGTPHEPGSRTFSLQLEVRQSDTKQFRELTDRNDEFEANVVMPGRSRPVLYRFLKIVGR